MCLFNLLISMFLYYLYMYFEVRNYSRYEARTISKSCRETRVGESEQISSKKLCVFSRGEHKLKRPKEKTNKFNLVYDILR